MSTQLTCATCGTAFKAPLDSLAASVVAEESARCARLGELAGQRKALEAARMQAGFAGVVEADTADLLVRRENMSRLESALKREFEETLRLMRHQRPD
jgi:hypothetical protein